MRNLKKVLSLALALVMLLGMMVVGAGAATSFKDDDKIQNKEAVSVLVSLGVMKGREDNSGITFQPNATLTRAEAAMMIAQLDLGVEAADALKANGTNPFSDVWSGYWAGGAIDYCVEQGYINGDGAGHFFPNQKVTGVQFASMLLRLLGYDAKIEGLVGDKWAVNAAALARKAGLTTNVLANNEDMTRDGMAQMAFNTLTAPTVEYEGMDLTIGDVAINARVKIRTHTGNALNNNNTTYDGEEIKSNITPIRLCEERFPDLGLVRDSLDNFGREFNVWTWKKVNIAGSESKVTPDAEFTKQSTASAVNSKINSAKGKAGNCELWVNGKLYDDIAVDGSLISKLTQNGRQVQVYLKDNDHTAIKKVVVVDTYVARVNSISKDGTDDRYVTVVPQNSSDKGVQTVTPVLDKDGKATYSTVDLVKTKKTASFAAGDLVTYTAAYNGKTYDIQDMDLLEIATTAKLEKWQGTNVIADDKGDSNANFTADGTKYEYSVNNAIVDEDGSPLYENGIAAFSAGKSEINIYVDQYDFVIFVSGVETPKNYAAVIGVGKSNQYGSETRGVTLLLPDNTKKEVTAWSDEWTKMVATNGTTVGTFPEKGTSWENLVTDALADVVTYSVGSDGVYTLKLAGVGYKQDKVSFTNGKSEFVIRNRADNSVKQTLYTTSKTIFMIASKDGNTCNYGVYTGYAAAPGLDSSKVNGVAYATNRYYTNQIDVVYIDADDVIGLASYTYFVKPEKPAVYTIEGQKYCTLNAVVDGEVTTIDIDATLLEGKAAGLYAITNIKKDSDTGIITRCTIETNTTVFKATNGGVKGTIGANGQVLGFGLLKGDTAPAYWAYNDSTKVYTIDKDYKTITASDVKSVPTAEDDLAFAAHDNGNPNKKLTNVFIVEDGAKGTVATAGKLTITDVDGKGIAGVVGKQNGDEVKASDTVTLTLNSGYEVTKTANVTRKTGESGLTYTYTVTASNTATSITVDKAAAGAVVVTAKDRYQNKMLDVADSGTSLNPTNAKAHWLAKVTVGEDIKWAELAGANTDIKSVTYDVYYNGGLVATETAAPTVSYADGVYTLTGDTTIALGYTGTVKIDITKVQFNEVKVRYILKGTETSETPTLVDKAASTAAKWETNGTPTDKNIGFGAKWQVKTGEANATFEVKGVTKAGTTSAIAWATSITGTAASAYNTFNNSTNCALADGDGYVDIIIDKLEAAPVTYSITGQTAPTALNSVTLANYPGFPTANTTDGAETLVWTFTGATNIGEGKPAQVKVKAANALRQAYSYTLSGTIAGQKFSVAITAADASINIPALNSDDEVKVANLTITSVPKMAVTKASWTADSAVFEFSCDVDETTGISVASNNWKLTDTSGGSAAVLFVKKTASNQITVYFDTTVDAVAATDTIAITATIEQDGVTGNKTGGTTFTFKAGGVFNNGSADLPKV